MKEKLEIRKARPDDIPVILNMIKELAEYEKLLDKVVATEDGLNDAIFGADQIVEVWLAEVDDEVVGHVFFFVISLPFSLNQDYTSKIFM